jgi:hypothetical protein
MKSQFQTRNNGAVKHLCNEAYLEGSYQVQNQHPDISRTNNFSRSSFLYFPLQYLKLICTYFADVSAQ